MSGKLGENKCLVSIQANVFSHEKKIIALYICSVPVYCGVVGSNELEMKLEKKNINEMRFVCTSIKPCMAKKYHEKKLLVYMKTTHSIFRRNVGSSIVWECAPYLVHAFFEVLYLSNAVSVFFGWGRHVAGFTSDPRART